MNLPVEGHPLHTRSLTIGVRSDAGGGLRLRGEVIDLRKCSFVPMPDGLQTAGIIHLMSLHGRVDAASRILESLQVEQPFVAVEPSEQTAGESCRDPAERLQALVGRRFDEGFAAALGEVFGGPRGCSHLLTLFHLIASALPGALDFEERQQRELGVARRPGERVFRRSLFLDGIEPEEGRLQLAVQLSDFHDKPAAACEDFLDRLALQREVRVIADLGLGGVEIESLGGWERQRSRKSLGSAEWEERTPWLEGLVGRPIMPGLGKELRRRLGQRPEARLLLDALLQLAPGFIQASAALADRMMSRFARDEAAPGGERKLPGFMALGGATDSCYMWRADGPLLQIRGGGGSL